MVIRTVAKYPAKIDYNSQQMTHCYYCYKLFRTSKFAVSFPITSEVYSTIFLVGSRIGLVSSTPTSVHCISDSSVKINQVKHEDALEKGLRSSHLANPAPSPRKSPFTGFVWTFTVYCKPKIFTISNENVVNENNCNKYC